VCTTGFAEGTAAYLNVTFEYDSGGSLSQLSSMFAMSVKFQNADIGDCIQVGGATEKCNHLFSWGTTLQSSDSGFYTALIDVQDAEYTFPNGNYEICFGNGDQSNAVTYGGFIGDATVLGLTTQPLSTLAVSSGNSQTLQTSFDLSIKSGQYVCSTGQADGAVNAVNVSFDYANGGSVSSISNMLAMSIKFVDADIGDCIQIGGQTEQCNHLYSWNSDSLQTSLPGSYQVLVDVSSAGYDFSRGNYEMCIGNGDQQDATSYAGFTGTSSFEGLSTVR
jgi:hypothetical protein